MVELSKSPAEDPPPDRSADADRGFFDLPDFAAIGRGIADWSRRNPAGLALIVALLGVLYYFYFDVKAFLGLKQSSAEWIMASWNTENDQEHCWAIVPIAVLLVLLRWRDLLAAPKTPANGGLWLVAAGVVAFIAGVRCIEGRYTIFALPLLILGAVAFLLGWSIARIILFPAVFLLFMTPVGGLIQGTAGLQAKTATVIQWLSTLFGIPIAVDGASIHSLDGRFETLEVAGGCSGIRSLMAMMTLAALYAYFMMRTPVRGLLLFVSSLIFAVLGNFARVFSVVVFARFIDPKIATGLYHDYSGFVFFPVAVLAMVSVGGLLNRDWEGWFHRRFRGPPSNPPVRPASGQPVAAEASATQPKPEEPRSTYDY